MIYAKITNTQRAQDFHSLCQRDLRNNYWIKEVVFREEIITYEEEDVEYSEWIVEAKSIKDGLLECRIMFTEKEVIKMIKEGRLIFK